jgi:hypothetical protein
MNSNNMMTDDHSHSFSLLLPISFAVVVLADFDAQCRSILKDLHIKKVLKLRRKG